MDAKVMMKYHSKRNALIIELRSYKLTYNEIAERLNITREMVAGVLFRNKHPRRFRNHRTWHEDWKKVTTMAEGQIPVDELEALAKKYNLDQLILVGRKIGENGRECCTAYGANAEHTAVANDIASFLKYKVMGWKK
jgi:hypothetical protein